MPYSGAGVYSFAPGTLPADGETIDASDVVTPLEDLAEAQNAARPVVAGGTGATTASGARTALGLAIGTDVQAYDAGLASIASLTTAADRMVYTTASDIYAVTTLTSYARTLLDDTTASAARTTLGVGDGYQATAPGAPANLNDVDECGVYQTSTSATNLPGTASVHALWGAYISANLGGQIAIDLSNSYTYVRREAGGTWASWVRLGPADDDIGMRQTWQDVSGSRVGTTTYQNTTGRPIMVAIRGSNNAAHEFQVSTDGATWVVLSSATNNGVPISFIVPPSHYYRYTGGTYNSWVELR